MTLSIVSLPETMAYIREDNWQQAALVQTLIDAATEAALATADGYDPATPAPARLRLAILAHVARAYDGRDTVDAPDGNGRLLMPFRTVDI